MGSKWRKAKLALGFNSCLHVPSTLEGSPASADASSRFSDADSLPPSISPAPPRHSDSRLQMPATPTPSSGHRLSKYSIKSSQRTCAICLNTMKSGQGSAIFTAECSHSFHFHCITSNVEHGNKICPICRANWKEIPFQSPRSDLSHGRARINPVAWPQDDAGMTVLRQFPPPRTDANQFVSLSAPEPSVFDDDELVENHPGISENSSFPKNAVNDHSTGGIVVKTYPEVSAVSRVASHNNFSILINLKAPLTSNCGISQTSSPSSSQNSRAPVDLVAVLDISGSMIGTKLALLKRAMGFVIQHLGHSDRLSVIAFSSTARRLFPLRRMSETGRQEALQAVNGLSSNGGTHISEGLRKGAKVMVDRRWKNPVSSIILLSDGQDTYAQSHNDYLSILPFSTNQNGGTGHQIPVHAFGFGADHDAALMHLLSEKSGGTFSFIEAESVIQDAFAQCIGGLLSVVVQEMQVKVQCVDPKLRLGSIKAGSYKTSMLSDARMGFIQVGDMYAEEERDFLVIMDIPVDESGNEMSLLKVGCAYRDPITEELLTLEETNEVEVQRPEIIGQLSVSLEVDRQRNRVRAAEAMAEARAAAEQGNLAGAVSVLECCRKALSESVSAQAGDQLCVALGVELTEIQERMANRRVYESSGRAYVLSGLSSHSWQRATARGDSLDSTSLLQAYQTPSMVDMVSRSQTLVFGSSAPQPSVRPAL